jgi:hypothetical protein
MGTRLKMGEFLARNVAVATWSCLAWNLNTPRDEEGAVVDGLV